MKIGAFYSMLIFVIICTYSDDLTGQTCESWQGPQAITSDNSDNRNATLVRRWDSYDSYYLFWERSQEQGLSEIVYKKYYDLESPLTIVSSEVYTVLNPQVIVGWWYGQDTIGYLFFETNQSGNWDINYCIWKNEGFSAPEQFANTQVDERHVNVSNGGGLVWQEGDKIKYSKLIYTESGMQFTSTCLIDSGLCFNPVIHHTHQDAQEEYIVWSRGSSENPEIWYCKWNWQTDEWGQPILLFNDGNHNNIRFSRSIYEVMHPMLISDFKDSTGNYGISVYDLYSDDEFKSNFRQMVPFQPDYFAVEPHTQDFWNYGYLSFNEFEHNNYNIYSSDQGFLEPELNAYCCLDESMNQKLHPQFYEGMEGGDCFYLEDIWESYLDGHWQLYSSYTIILSGKITENNSDSHLDIFASPNPFQDVIKIGYSLNISSTVKIRIFNISGQLVAQFQPVNSIPGYNEKILSLPELPIGRYLINVQAESITGSVSVIKN
jgi:hypothetical protein